jgi:hypothetical protein
MSTYKQVFGNKFREFLRSDTVEKLVPASNRIPVALIDSVKDDILWTYGTALYLHGSELGTAVFDKDIDGVIASAEEFDRATGISVAVLEEQKVSPFPMPTAGDFNAAPEDVRNDFWNRLQTLYVILHKALTTAQAGSSQ